MFRLSRIPPVSIALYFETDLAPCSHNAVKATGLEANIILSFIQYNPQSTGQMLY